MRRGGKRWKGKRVCVKGRAQKCVLREGGLQHAVVLVRV